MIKLDIVKFLGLVGIALVIACSTYGQSIPMNQFELASHARASARALSDASEYEAALAVLNSLEAGKYAVGDAATQTAAAKIQGVLTDKGRLLIKLGRYSEADNEFYRAYDANIAQAEKDLEYVRENGTGVMPTAGSRVADALISASGAVSRAKAVFELRDASYILGGASNAAKPFDAGRLAKYESLKKGLARFMPR